MEYVIGLALGSKNLHGVCNTCGIPRPEGTRCKPCRNAYLKSRYEADPARQAAAKHRYYANHPEMRKKHKISQYANWKAKLADAGLTTCGNPITPPLTQEERAVRHRASRKAAERNRVARERSAPGRVTSGEIKALFETQNRLCALCTDKLSSERSSFHVDHIIPMVLGGSNLLENLQLLCGPCNRRKHTTAISGIAHRLYALGLINSEGKYRLFQ